MTEEMPVILNDKYLADFVRKDELDGIAPCVMAAAEILEKKSGQGNDFLGWLDLPTIYPKTEEYARIKETALKIQKQCDVLIVIGIGGSYLGARAALEFLKTPQYNELKKETPNIYFVGNNISADHLTNIFSLCEGKEVCVNVISKSGTTTEPAIAFRIFKEYMENRYGKEEAVKRIYCTTDKAKGTLKSLADDLGYETFVVPDDVGGRFSVLTAVGLLPLAVAGVDLDALMNGALKAYEDAKESDLQKNHCYRYAAYRNILYRKGKTVEVSCSYEPCFAMMCEWIKQLYGESEGKDGKGIYPTSAIFSTDLHSLGQYIQDGSRILFETVYHIQKTHSDVVIQHIADNFDGLNFLAGKHLQEVNDNAFMGTMLSHVEGGVPNMVLELPDVSEATLGYLIYFLEKACAISGYLLGVNPFDQPGVEGYKKNMFALLGKPGYEELAETLTKKLS